MDKASASGAGDSRFESWADHLVEENRFARRKLLDLNLQPGHSCLTPSLLPEKADGAPPSARRTHPLRLDRQNACWVSNPRPLPSRLAPNRSNELSLNRTLARAHARSLASQTIRRHSSATIFISRQIQANVRSVLRVGPARA